MGAAFVGTGLAERPAMLHHPDSRAKASAGWLAALWQPLALAVFAAWVLVVGSHHEPWADEAQAWLIARDNGLWELLSQRVRYEGTPGLWHSVLWCAIHAGLPYAKLYLLPATCAIAGAALVLWRAPFPPALRLGLLVTNVFGYQYSVIARSYSLDLLLVPLLAVFFARRVERPLRYALVVGLIANANAHGFLAAAVLGLEFAWQLFRAKRLASAGGLAGVALAGGLGLFAVFCAWQPADSAFLDHTSRPFPPLSAAGYLCNAMVDRLSVWSSQPQGKIDIFFAVLASVLLVRPGVKMLHAGQNRWVLLGVLGALLTVSGFVYADRWVSGTLMLFYVFALWAAWNDAAAAGLRRNATLALAAICALQGVQTLRTGAWDITHVYSPGKAAAEAVSQWQHDHPTGKMAIFGFKSFEVQPWLAGNPFANYHHAAPHPAYIVWTKGERWKARTNIVNWVQLLATKPDLVLASRADFTPRFEPLVPWARVMGYRVYRAFPATLVWRGALVEEESLYIFERVK